MRGIGETDRSDVVVPSILGRGCLWLGFGTALMMLASCASSQPQAKVGKSKTTEYFAESEYGVKASPRVSNRRSRLPRGGGREQVGKPYMVKGKWYYPKEDPSYRKVGTASWYGSAFHGRLTANGEVYDMTHLTAAHPTMPLPSYARVTNLANGSSVVVRVNDRGPFSHGRLIDLSQRAAELLDYTRSGTAKVEVEYIGRAPLDGRDEQYLMASYRPGGQGPAGVSPDEIAPGVMIAMAGPTPVSRSAAAPPFPGQDDATAGAGDLTLPGYGPIPPARPPLDLLASVAPAGSGLLQAYAGNASAPAARAVGALAGGGMSPSDIVRSWQERSAHMAGEFIAAGTFASRLEAEANIASLSKLGRVELQITRTGDASWYSVNLYSDGRYSADAMLMKAWDAGAGEAILVRR